MTGAYLTNLPMKFIRSVAGYSHRGVAIHLPRAEPAVPENLKQQVWPWIEEWLERFERFRATKASFNQGGLDEEDHAGSLFLDLLKRLRVVLFQDLAILQPDYPELPFFSQPLFSTAEWKSFAKTAREGQPSSEEEATQNGLLERAVPEIASTFAAGTRAFSHSKPSKSP
jgi:hypothetical protein